MSGLLFSSSLSDSHAGENWKLQEPIVTFWAGPMPVTPADAKLMAEGNWNLIPLSPTRGRPEGTTPAEFVKSQLDILHQHQLKAILSSLWNAFDYESEQGWAELDALISGIKDHPALYAYGIKDEPGTQFFPFLKKVKDRILELDSSHVIFTNLYPVGAPNKYLGVEGTPEEAYRAYLDTAIKELNPRILSYDHYHFKTNGDGKTFFLNLALAREAALKADIPWMTFIQASSWTTGVRIPTGEEMRWLTYVPLAYGVQGIGHYVYGYPEHDGGMVYPSARIGNKETGAVLGGPPTPLYYYVKELNKEFTSVAKALRPLRSLGVYHVGTIPEGGTPLPKDFPFQFDPPIASRALKELEDPEEQKLSPAEIEALFDQGGLKGSRVEGFLIGTFGEKENPTHALVVNLDYRTYSGRSQPRRDEFLDPLYGKIARQALKGPGELELFDPATSDWTALNSDRVELTQPPGAGLLIRLKP